MQDLEKISNVDQAILELVAEILEEEPSSIDSDAHFVKDLGMDSMMALEILGAVPARAV